MEEDEAVQTPTAAPPKQSAKGKKLFQCKVCGEHFSRAWALVQHLSIHTGEKPFRCDRCSCSFNSLGNLHKHQRMKHNVDVAQYEERKRILADDRLYKCDQCDNRYKNRRTLLKHRRVKHLKVKQEELGVNVPKDDDEKRFKCAQCGSSYKTKGALRKHKHKKHQVVKDEGEETAVTVKGGPKKLPNADEKPFQPDQGEDFTTDSSLRYGPDGKGPDAKCDDCGRSFENITRLRIHRRLHEGKQIHPCRFCGIEFLCRSHLSIHERKHTGERPFKCDHCKVRFISISSLNVHMCRFHRETPSNLLKCDQCGCKFTNRKQLEVHQVECSHVKVESHLSPSNKGEAYDSDEEEEEKTNIKQETPDNANVSLTCKECGKRFVSRRQFLVHEYLHKGKQLPTCKYCGKNFLNGDTLKVHERIHIRGRLYSCGRTLTSVGKPQSHQSTQHPGRKLAPSQTKYVPFFARRTPMKEYFDKPHKCEHCGRGFKCKNHLQEHTYIHTGRPYSCDVCGHSFIRMLHLLRHQKGKCGLTLMTCRHCSESFISRAQLGEHQRRHHGASLYRCKRCGLVFSDSKTLKLHSLKTHGGCEGDGDRLGELSCGYCGKSFSDPGGFVIHRCQDQSPEETFTCRDCGAVVKLGGTTLSNVFTVTSLSNVQCFLNNHAVF